jgi:hypothetical protein
MRGAGIGSFLGGLMKKAAPALLNVAKTVGRHAVGVAREALEGGDAAGSVNRGLRSAGGEILDDVYDVVADNGQRRRRRTAVKRRSSTRGGRAKRRRDDVGIPLDG